MIKANLRLVVKIAQDYSNLGLPLGDLIAEGNKNKEIAVLLYISVKTVEKHRANLIKKLDLHNSAALTAYAIKNLRLFGNGETGLAK